MVAVKIRNGWGCERGIKRTEAIKAHEVLLRTLISESVESTIERLLMI